MLFEILLVCKLFAERKEEQLVLYPPVEATYLRTSTHASDRSVMIFTFRKHLYLRNLGTAVAQWLRWLLVGWLVSLFD